MEYVQRKEENRSLKVSFHIFNARLLCSVEDTREFSANWLEITGASWMDKRFLETNFSDCYSI